MSDLKDISETVKASINAKSLPGDPEDITNFNEFYKSISGHFSKLVEESYKAPASFKEAIAEFAAAVNWKESWIQVLLVWHVIYFTIFLITRKNSDIQTVQFFITFVLVYFSENVNNILGQHWELFATQNYFDKRGVFMCTLWAGPLLFTALCQLINFVTMMGSMLIVAKRLELKDRRKKQSQNNEVVDGDTKQAQGENQMVDTVKSHSSESESASGGKGAKKRQNKKKA
jgi:transmembrane protein 18